MAPCACKCAVSHQDLKRLLAPAIYKELDDLLHLRAMKAKGDFIECGNKQCAQKGFQFERSEGGCGVQRMQSTPLH